jgi:hypothetical protein
MLNLFMCGFSRLMTPYTVTMSKEGEKAKKQ